MGMTTEEAFARYPELSNPETWLRKRYGIESGTVIYDIIDDPAWRLHVFFTDDGEREMTRYYLDDTVTLWMSTLVTMEGSTHQNLDPTDDELRRYRTSFLEWGPRSFLNSWNQPNFSHLTREQIECFDITLMGTRTFLGRTVLVYHMVETRPEWRAEWDVWVWKGIVLYKKQDAYFSFDGVPISRTAIWKAISIDESEPPEEVFNLND